jgi:transcriptional regulator with XRE-family HTH domain
MYDRFSNTDSLIMITSAQMRAARALLGIDQKTLAARAGVSVPTIQRMEASDGNVRGVVGSLVRVIEALDALGVELIGEQSPSQGTGRGVRLKAPPESPPDGISTTD